MVLSRVETVALDLNPTAVYGKAAAGDDFDLLSCSAETISSDVVAVAAAWLRVYLSTSNAAVTALHCIGGRWWFMRAQRESSVDSVGRQRAFVALGGIDHLPDACAVPGALVQLARMVVSKTEPPRRVEAPLTSPSPDESAAAAVLALAVGEPFAAVGPLACAAATLERLLPGPLTWIALLTDQCPASLPSGSGLVISSDRIPPPTELSECVERHGAAAILGLPLSTLPAHANRFALVRAALGEAVPLGELSKERAAVEWLARIPKGRAVLIASLPRNGVLPWLSSSLVRPDDLESLADRLGPEHQDVVRKLLHDRHDAIASYSRFFPTDVAGMVELLGPDNARTWQALGKRTATLPTAASVVDLLTAIKGTPVLSAMGVGRWARAVRAGCHQALGPFQKSLNQAGLPAVLVRMLHGGAMCDLPDSSDLAPDASWLQGLDPKAWFRIRAAFSSPAWRAWWFAGVEIYAAEGWLDRKDLLRIALMERDIGLLEVARAPAELIRLADPNGARVSLPPNPDWPAEANELLALLHSDQSLFRRIQGTLTDAAIAWLDQRLPNSNIGLLRQAVNKNEPVSAEILCLVGDLLPRSMLLRQVSVWGQRKLNPEHRACLNYLLKGPQCTAAEQAWLAALTLFCEPLPPAPAWSASDLTDLLPLLDPVRDVVRVILTRPERESGEDLLLERLAHVLRERPVSPPGVFPAMAWAKRPDWIATLVGIPGWAHCANESASLRELVSELCRRLLEKPDSELPGETRNAIAHLAGGIETC